MAEAEKQYSKETTSFLLKEKIADMIKYGKKGCGEFSSKRTPDGRRDTPNNVEYVSALNRYREEILQENHSTRPRY